MAKCFTYKVDPYDFDPMAMVDAMLAAGFELETTVCPVKIKPPWRLDKNRVTGEFTYHQWNPAIGQKEPQEGPWGIRVDGKP